jgi:hypothetical protein
MLKGLKTAVAEQAEAAQQQTETGWRDLAKIAAAGTAVIVLLSALAVTGVLGQAQREHPSLFIVALGLVLGAAALWVLAAVVTNGSATTWAAYTGAIAQAVGIAMFLAGTLCGVTALVFTQHNPNRPSISASLDNDTLTATVKAGGLDAHDRVGVFVDGLTQTGETITATRNLYFASIGANSDGDVELPIKLDVPGGRFDALGVRAFTAGESECDLKGKVVKSKEVGPGCIVLLLPTAPLRPQLAVTWAGSDAKPKLTATATATNVWQRMLSVQVVGRAGQSVVRLSRSASVATASGDAQAAITVTVPSGFSEICIAARLLKRLASTSKERCPVMNRASAAIYEFRVPS